MVYMLQSIFRLFGGIASLSLPLLLSSFPMAASAEERPTLFVAGDSTAAPGSGDEHIGWAVPFAEFFDSGELKVDNRARGCALTLTV